ncbi:neuron navigator 2 [Plakobranchus ocellatus]|uniref:Neuron navigator 2 n=1 Tax=Plakobranchus ocellatus TaxID=259542 RepID=A0AAV4DYD8_9GAST|nr:neuron navigator 2 [Plakobranchus ocellatus]
MSKRSRIEVLPLPAVMTPRSPRRTGSRSSRGGSRSRSRERRRATLPVLTIRMPQNLVIPKIPDSHDSVHVTWQQTDKDGSSSLIPLRSSNASSGGAARAVSPYGSTPPAPSGIPTATGRGIPSSRSQTLADKQSNRTSAGSTTSTSSSKSATATSGTTSGSAAASSKPPASAPKNSMLDKFKFFKDKDKNKDKEKEKDKDKDKSGGGSSGGGGATGGGGVVKSASKSSTSTASTSASSRSDTSSSDTTGKSSSFTTTTSSSSGHSSASGDQHGIGASGGTVPSNPATPSKSAGKSGKKSSLVRAFSSSKKEQQHMQQQQQQQQPIHQQQQPLPPTPEDAHHYQQQQQQQLHQHARSAVPPPIPSAAGLGPPTGGPYPNTAQSVSSASSHRHASPSQARKSSKSDRDRDRERADARHAAASPTPTSSSSSKRSKLAGLTGIPKTQSSSGKSSSKSPSSVPPSVSSPSIPSSSTGIPKPSSSSSGKTKMSKEDKAKAAAAGKEYNKALYKDLPGTTPPKQISSGSKSSSSSSPHHQQQQQAAAYQQTHPHHQQQQQQQGYSMRQHQQQQHYSQTYPMQHHQYPGYGGPEYQYSSQHGYTPPYAHNPGYATPSRSAQPGSPLVQNVHPRVNMQAIERQQQQQQVMSHHHQQQQQQNKTDQASAFAASSTSSSTPSSSSASTRSAQASHYVPVTIPAVNMDTHPSNTGSTSASGTSSGGTGSRSMKQMLPQSPMMSPNMNRHNPSVNVVKPTISSSTSQSVGSSPSTTQKSNKSDSNTQTNLSVLHRSVTPKQHMLSSTDHSGKSSPKPESSSNRHESSKTRPSPSGSPHVSNKSSFHGKERGLDNIHGSATPSQSPATSKRNGSSEHSSRKTSSKENLLSATNSNQSELDANVSSGLEKLAIKDGSTSTSSHPSVNTGPDKLMSSTTSTISPKLGVKMLGPHIPKNASNVAVVQPRPGEKMETTFDAEVRTETIQELGKTSSSGKETTFLTPEKEEKTTFLDDAGEAMDIKPMPPIMRALPYGYFRGYSGYGGFSNRNFHIPAMYATRAATGSAQGLGLPRPLTDQSPAKYYSSQMKRAGSSHNPASSSDDYASESDSYDYVSGYMSDGEILKNSSSYNSQYMPHLHPYRGGNGTAGGNGNGGPGHGGNGGVGDSGLGGGDDWASGYLSEGGASLYARRLQQRFREGMQAVRECMQKSSSAAMDDDSFDDSSSISSGEISDTIAEISTDENLTGSSQGALSDHHPLNPYSSIKRGPHSLHAGYLSSNGGNGGIAAGIIPPGYVLAGGPAGMHQGYSPLHHQQQVGYKRVPNLGTSAFMGTDYNSDSGIGSGVGGPSNGGSPWGRKYSLPQAGSKFSSLSNDPNKLLSSDPSDYGYGYGWPSSRSDSGGVYSSLRKMSSGSNPDYAYHSEGDYDAPGPPSNMRRRSFSPLPPPGGVKRDTETNTDQSHLLEASLRRLQTSASSGSGLGRNGGSGVNPPSSNGAGTQFGYRRSLSNASNHSLGSPTKGTPPSSSSKNSPGSSAVGSRLAKHGIETGGNQQMGTNMMMPPRPASATGRPMMHPDMMVEGGSGYHTSPSSATSTLERKRKNGNGSLTSSKSTGCTQTQTPALLDRGAEYQSNSLGRRRLFAGSSKHCLSKSSSQDAAGPGGAGQGVAGSPSNVGGTIISNPHATYGRSAVEQHHQQLLQQQATSHYVNMQELHARANYVSLDFPPSPRNSGLVASGGAGIHGSNLSLVSSTSSVYSSAEEKQAHEIRKLKRDLMLAQEKVQTLTCQLSNNVSTHHLHV